MRQTDLVLGTLGFSINAVHAHLWSRVKNDVSLMEKKETKNGRRDGEKKNLKIKFKEYS
jgi:hypothetical protein